MIKSVLTQTLLPHVLSTEYTVLLTVNWAFEDATTVTDMSACPTSTKMTCRFRKVGYIQRAVAVESLMMRRGTLRLTIEAASTLYTSKPSWDDVQYLIICG